MNQKIIDILKSKDIKDEYINSVLDEFGNILFENKDEIYFYNICYEISKMDINILDENTLEDLIEYSNLEIILNLLNQNKLKDEDIKKIISFNSYNITVLKEILDNNIISEHLKNDFCFLNTNIKHIENIKDIIYLFKIKYFDRVNKIFEDEINLDDSKVIYEEIIKEIHENLRDEFTDFLLKNGFIIKY